MSAHEQSEAFVPVVDRYARDSGWSETVLFCLKSPDFDRATYHFEDSGVVRNGAEIHELDLEDRAFMQAVLLFSSQIRNKAVSYKRIIPELPPLPGSESEMSESPAKHRLIDIYRGLKSRIPKLSSFIIQNQSYSYETYIASTDRYASDEIMSAAQRYVSASLPDARVSRTGSSTISDQETDQSQTDQSNNTGNKPSESLPLGRLANVYGSSLKNLHNQGFRDLSTLSPFDHILLSRLVSSTRPQHMEELYDWFMESTKDEAVSFIDFQRQVGNFLKHLKWHSLNDNVLRRRVAPTDQTIGVLLGYQRVKTTTGEDYRAK